MKEEQDHYLAQLDDDKLPSIGEPFRQGEVVLVTGADGETVKAVVTHASPNGRSLMLTAQFSERVGGACPVFQVDNGMFLSVFTGSEVKIARDRAGMH